MFARLVSRFCRDERGNFAITFGVMAIVLVAMGGAVVDYVFVDQTRNRAQIALDSAALALQPQIYSLSTSELKTKAKILVEERLGDTDVTVAMTDSDVSVDTDEGSLQFTTKVTVPMSFVSLVGIDTLTAEVISKVTRKKLNLEVAFVLDNSGSMGSYSRMTNLKSAATCATNILFYGTCTPDAGATANTKTKIAVVPFNFFVNIGSGNSGAAWIDSTGSGSIANDNFDNDDDDTTPYTGTVDRLALYAGMNNISWAGCLEARPYPYSVNDTTPDASSPDTLFVPEFAPDESSGSGSYSNSYIADTGGTCDPDPTWAWTQVKSNCNYPAYNSSYYNGASCSGTTNSYLLTYPDGSTSTTVTSQPSSIGNFGNPTSSTNYSYTGSYGNYTNTRVRTYTYHLSDREYQERLCKYAGATPGYLSSSKGPNAGCPSTALLPLTDTVATILSRISAMVSDGATNIHQGVIWGFRALSPTVPFTEGRDYDTATSKVMIVMTDGENTYYTSSNMNGTSYYAPYGYLWNERVGTYGSETAASMQTKTDTLTLEACTNAKGAGIEIYTIGLNPPTTATQTMLTNCASDASKAYFPTDPSELNTVFSAIAEQLAKLRIEK